MRIRFFFPLLLCMLLVACSSAPEDAPVPGPTAITTMAVSTETAVAQPTTNPTPTVPATVEPTVQPEGEIDPFMLARRLIEQVRPTAPQGWQMEPCEGEAAVLCIRDAQENVGYAELLIFPLTGYAVDHPLRLAAAELPADAAAYSADHTVAARQALTALAEEHLDAIAADRAMTYPDDAFTPLLMESAQLGSLPALSFGFVHTNPAGEVVERYLNVAAFDRQFVYWFGVNFDPANVSTFVSDTAVTRFAPFFLQVAASLPLHLSSLPEAQISDGALARLLVMEAATVLPEGWRLYACEDGPTFCLSDREEKIAWVELGLISISSYEADDPIRLAAAALPVPGVPFSAEQEAIARQALTDAAAARLEQEEANRREYFPAHKSIESEVQFVPLGPLPAIAFGHTLLNPDGEVASQWRWVIALDQQAVYWFSLPVSITLAAAEVEAVTTVFHDVAAQMPVYDPDLRSLPALPPLVSYAEQSGDFPYEAIWSLAIDPPPSSATVAVLSQPAQIEPLTAIQATVIAQRYGFDTPLYVEARGGLPPAAAADLGLFVAIAESRILSFSGQPYSFSDVANWNQGPELNFAQAAPLAERFLQENGWLPFPYEMAESDQGKGVLFLPIVEGMRLLTPAYSVRVAANGGVSDMSIYPLEHLAPVGDYPVMTAEIAWRQFQNRPDAPGNFYRIVPPVEVTAVSSNFPVDYTNIPAPGESGDVYTNIWAFRPLEGDAPLIIQSSEFFRVTGNAAMLEDLAAQTDYLVHLWGAVHESASGLPELELSYWETVPNAGGLPTFFGVVEQDGDQIFLVDEANRTTYLLPDAPAGLQTGDYVAAAGWPETEDGSSKLLWQKISVYPPQGDVASAPTAVPLQIVTVESVRLVYLPQPAHATGLSHNLFMPAWEFAGAADNGAEITVWVTAVLPEFITPVTP